VWGRSEAVPEWPSSLTAYISGHRVKQPQLPTMNTLARAAKIIFQPSSEWQAIKRDRTTTLRLYLTYIIPLAAIPPLSYSLGIWILVTLQPFVEDVTVSFYIEQTVAYMLMDLVSIYILALLASAGAPLFSAERNFRQALKVVAYASTPIWLSGIFLMSPLPNVFFVSVGVLSRLYAAYLLYLGLPIVMRVSKDKVIMCCAFVAGAYLALSWLVRITAPYATDLWNLAKQPVTYDAKVVVVVVVLVLSTAALVLLRHRASRTE